MSLFLRLCRFREHFNQDHRKALARDSSLMNGAAGHDYQIAFVDSNLLAARRRLASPFAGRDFLRVRKRSAQRQRRRPLEDVVNIVGRIVHLEVIILALLVMENRDPHLRPRRRHDVEILVAILLLEAAINVGYLLFCLYDKWF